MKNFFFILLLLIGIFQISWGQSENDEKVNTSIKFKSPRTTRIINILLNRDDVYYFCDNFYDFYYTIISNDENIYYIVEKQYKYDSIIKNNAMRINSFNLKLELMNVEQYKKVFIIPLY